MGAIASHCHFPHSWRVRAATPGLSIAALAALELVESGRTAAAALLLTGGALHGAKNVRAREATTWTAAARFFCFRRRDVAVAAVVVC